MEFLDVLSQLESDLIVEFQGEFFVTDQLNRVGVHIEEFILQEELSDKDSQDAFEFHDRHAIHIDDLYYVGDYIIS